MLKNQSISNADWQNDLDDILAINTNLTVPPDYEYDEIGNLIEDEVENIDDIEWTISGKVKKITFAPSTNKGAIEFHYDAMGNRTSKIVKKGEDKNNWDYTFYQRDAQGNVISVYESKEGSNISIEGSYFAFDCSNGEAITNISCGSLILLNTTITPVNGCDNVEFVSQIFNEILDNYSTHGINAYVDVDKIYFDCLNISVTSSSQSYQATSTTIDTKNLGLAQTERNIFGSSRKGIDKTNKTLSEGYYFGSSPNFTKFDEAIPLVDIAMFSGFMPNSFQIYINGESVLNTPYSFVVGASTDLDFANDMASDINQYSNEYNASVKYDTQLNYYLRIWPKSITKFKTNSNYITYTQNGVGFANSLPAEFTELSKYQRKLGNKSFELTNHLGNVNAVISDRIKYGNLIFYNNFNLDAGNFNVADWTTENTCTNLSINGGNLQSDNTGCGSEYFTTLELTNKFVIGQAYTVEYTSTNTPVAKIKNDGIYENVTNNSITFIAKSTDIDILFTYEYQGSKTFEISNLKIYQAKSADVLAYYDYYPFGMIMPGRSYTSQSYRYGFNGMEKDDELKGTGNSYDFGARMQDPRLGRWLSLDPESSAYPSYSDYSFVANSPLKFIDPSGKIIVIVGQDGTKHEYKPNMELPNDKFVEAAILSLNKLSESKSFGPKLDELMKHETTAAIKKSNTTVIHGGVYKIGHLGLYGLQNEVDIDWNPSFGLVGAKGTDQEGKTLLPFEALGHELGHRYNAIMANDNGETYYENTTPTGAYDKEDPNYNWTNPEEKNNIQNNEIPLTKERENGLVRNGHKHPSQFPDANYKGKKDFTSPVPAPKVE